MASQNLQANSETLWLCPGQVVGRAGVCYSSECAGDRLWSDNLLDWHLLQPDASCHLHHKILLYLLYQEGDYLFFWCIKFWLCCKNFGFLTSSCLFLGFTDKQLSSSYASVPSLQVQLLLPGCAADWPRSCLSARHCQRRAVSNALFIKKIKNDN